MGAMVVKERISEEEYQRLALDTPDVQWELHRGELREKPGMSFDHNWLMFHLGYLIQQQLDMTVYQVRVNAGRVRKTSENYYIPDLFVIPVVLGRALRGRSDILESYDAPLPLVVEVWSPSTGEYDVDSKLPEYQARGDNEIWRLHPYDHTLTTWVRQDNGSYAKTVYEEGIVQLASLPNVAIDLAILFAD